MLDLDRLHRIRLKAEPVFQRVVAYALLAPNYELPPRVRIDFEGTDRVPDEPVILAMNHTDRYNYWPFQYAWWRRRGRFTATWVKGKYYENEWVGRFMEMTNNIPTVSRGYLITKDMLATLGRRPSDEEYEALRALVNAAAHGEERAPDPVVPKVLLTEPRDILGRRFDPASETYGVAIDQLFRAMMRRFVELNEEASALGLDLLIFPQGTRSVRLSRGHIGLSQMAMHLGRTVVPVGCSGSDKIYPGSSPIAKPGRVVYRFGEPVRPKDAVSWVDRREFEPFTPEAEAEHREAFQAYVDDIMDRIEQLVDPEYRFAEDGRSQGVAGSNRFV
jgi:1-acyl-sn-glycerol-3-phosphate acyltransferase